MWRITAVTIRSTNKSIITVATITNTIVIAPTCTPQRKSGKDTVSKLNPRSRQTVHLTPRNLNPEPKTLNPEPKTLNPEPKTLNPEP